jgi:hypothetical protein
VPTDPQVYKRGGGLPVKTLVVDGDRANIYKRGGGAPVGYIEPFKLSGGINSGTTPPDSPQTGDVWINTSTTPPTLNIWDGSDWQEVGGGGGGSANIAYGPNPPLGVSAGAVWINTSNDPPTLEVYNGSAWEVVVGEPGADGADGADGAPGTPGAPGAAAGFGSASASTIAYGQTPTVSITGPATASVWAFGIPAGQQGPAGTNGTNGTPGASAGLATPPATASGLASTQPPTATISGPATAMQFQFGIPAGAAGAPGADGIGWFLTSYDIWPQVDTDQIVPDENPSGQLPQLGDYVLSYSYDNNGEYGYILSIDASGPTWADYLVTVRWQGTLQGPQGDPGPAGSVPITVSPTPPANPNVDDLWIDTGNDPTTGSRVLLQTKDLSGATVADFETIDQTFKHLEIELMGNATISTSTNGSDQYITFNGDFSVNYGYSQIVLYTGSGSPQTTLSSRGNDNSVPSAGALVGQLGSQTATTSFTKIIIPFYSYTKPAKGQVAFCESYAIYSWNDSVYFKGHVWWDNASPITGIWVQIIPNVTGQEWGQGSVALLYGLR